MANHATCLPVAEAKAASSNLLSKSSNLAASAMITSDTKINDISESKRLALWIRRQKQPYHSYLCPIPMSQGLHCKAAKEWKPP